MMSTDTKIKMPPLLKLIHQFSVMPSKIQGF